MKPRQQSPAPDATAAERIAPAYRPRQVEKAPPCQAGCPNCGDIRGWIGVVAQRERLGLSREQAFEQAWRTITEVNPFPATLGRICPHPCEARCNRAEFDEPLAINALERFLGDFAIHQSWRLPLADPTATSLSIGVVGAGPSGLSFAYQMARRGYRVTVYDAREQAGGMLRYGVPDYRLPQAILDAEIQRILELGVELELGVSVGRDLPLDELRRRHRSLYLGIGAQRGRALPVTGAEGPGAMTGTDYLGRINRGEPLSLGERVIVVGGGNTAIDSARCARRSGAAVTILYRRSRSEMPAAEREIEEALEEGVELVELAAPVAIERDADGRVCEVRVQRMTLGEPDDSGRRTPAPLGGSAFALPADAVIMAVSQVPALGGLESLRQEAGWLVADEAGAVGERVLAGGDVLGVGIAGNAIVQGRKAAEALHRRLAGLGPQAEPGDPSGMDPGRIRFESKAHSKAARRPRLPAGERVAMGMREVTGNLPEEDFLAEVQRCFSCGSCSGCAQCQMYCTTGCFTQLQEPRPGMYFALQLDSCQNCGKCIEVCPCGFLEDG